ncbi:MAG: hypothetical protein QME74_10660, partial [Candidatus Edwardsbacteria bacterium]|nr:hypothetical protein [Candidatus Edwardsbacteria bacterium]
TDNGTPAGFVLDPNWGENPRRLFIGSAIDGEKARSMLISVNDGALYSVCRDESDPAAQGAAKIFKIRLNIGTLYDGNWPVAGHFDETATLIGGIGDYMLVGMTGTNVGNPNDREVIKITRSDGVPVGYTDAGISTRNNCGAFTSG